MHHTLMTITKGAQRLGAYRKRVGLTGRDFAKQLGVSYSGYRNWESGDAPNLRMAIKLNDLAGIPFRAWVQAAE